jgi:hypothetical protein
MADASNNPPHRAESLDSLPERVREAHLTPPNSRLTLIAKFGKERITLASLGVETTIGRVKELLQEQTRILPKRQKLVGLVAVQGGAKGVTDDLPLSGLKIKGGGKTTNGCSNGTTVHQFILMGTPEEEIFVDPSDRDDLPDVSVCVRACVRAYSRRFNWSAASKISTRSLLFSCLPHIFTHSHH